MKSIADYIKLMNKMEEGYRNKEPKVVKENFERIMAGIATKDLDLESHRSKLEELAANAPNGNITVRIQGSLTRETYSKKLGYDIEKANKSINALKKVVIDPTKGYMSDDLHARTIALKCSFGNIEDYENAVKQYIQEN